MGEPKEDSTDVGASSESVQVSHVSVKPPPFYVKSPSTWFKQMESQFHLAKISSSATKFHHVLACLPENIACELPLDSLGDDYDELKKAVVSNLTANKHELIEQALSTVPLGDKRPTSYVNELKRKFAEVGVAPEEAIIRSRLLSALPNNIRAALVGHDGESLEAFARIADSMVAVAGHQSTPYHVGHVSSDQRYSQNSSGATKSGFRPFYSDQRPKICNAHIFYADRARTCRHWCRWPNKPAHILRRGEKTPAQSRSNSPERKND